MDLNILKKKIDGYRIGNGSIKNVPPELLLELRQSWEHYAGSVNQFRSELGMKSGTLRNLLVESKKLNHVIASTGALEFATGEGRMEEVMEAQANDKSTHTVVELVFDNGTKVIRFPGVDLLVDFLRRSA